MRLQPAAAAAPGAAAGALLALAAAAAVLAAQSLGLAVALPGAQVGAAVAGLVAVVAYGELPLLVPQVVYWLGVVVLLGGIALMTGAGGA